MRYRLILVLLATFASTTLKAMNAITPKGLEMLSSVAVYSVVQDSEGAIWLNSSRGLIRYNGHCVDVLQPQLPWKNLASTKRFVYALSSDHLIEHNVLTLAERQIKIPGVALSSAVIVADSSALYIASKNLLYSFTGKTVNLICSLPDNKNISSLELLSDGTIAAGTEDGCIYNVSGARESLICSPGSRVRSLHFSGGILWVGLQKGGLVSIDPASGKIRQTISNAEGDNLYEVRAISSDKNGTIYFGTPGGLYSVSKDGTARKENLGGHTQRPICCIFNDIDENIWTGTYYNGIFLSNASAFPFEQLTDDKSDLIVKGLAQNSDGSVFIFTDGNGMLQLPPGSLECTVVPGTGGIKFQEAYYDPVSDAIWAGDFQGGIYKIKDGRIKRFQAEDSDLIVKTIHRRGNNLLVGGSKGLFVFNPESATWGRIEDMDCYVYDIAESPDGTIWISSAGIFTYSPLEGTKKIRINCPDDSWPDNSPCYDLEFDSEGEMWLAYSRHGVVHVKKDGSTVHLTAENSKLLDNATYCLAPLMNGSTAVSTLGGISVLSRDGKCQNYPMSPCTSILKTYDGSILCCGNEGVKRVRSGFDCGNGHEHIIKIDHFYVNGKPHEARTLSHDESNFSFDMSTFDYTQVEARAYFGKLEGFDKDWVSFDINSPVVYMNMRPGRYTFRVQMRSLDGTVLSEDSLSLRLKQVWYASWWMLTIVILLLLISAGAFLYNRYTSRRFKAELQRKERENMEKTQFFINISYQLRTPLNLIIGTLERFFTDFGSRTAGIENLESVYSKTKQMRRLISEYVDTQNEELLNSQSDEDSEERVQNAKWLNSATGVVERNLYAPDLNLDTLCAGLNVGKTTLTYRMKEVCGMTPRVFIEDIKLKHAAQMLKERTYKVAEIANLLNFSSAKYFSIRFKLKYGVSPAEYGNQK